ncbi:hypothetical protein MSG_04258 [Mycobacterium shigaense]|uniref:Uncharacterized protein n=1 Tax=Mycobacterium shigaense TaxID=722731 RepID=A0A1Z4EN05_9MYCO|nr:hypothetical protein MSG_04258 [Mycobacterium shigaense]
MPLHPFPTVDIAKFRAIAKGMLAEVQGDVQSCTRDRIEDLEIAWEEAEPSLRSMDGKARTVLDRQTNPALTALRAAHPDPAAETRALDTLLSSLHWPCDSPAAAALRSSRFHRRAGRRS